MTKFVLASQSPRRKELLSALGLDFRVLVDTSPETVDGLNPPHIVVQSLARQKAEHILPNCFENEIIIAADTVVVLNNQILGKPADENIASEMLHSLSGNTHQVYTGICVIDVSSQKIYTDYESTYVTFKHLSDSEITAYIKSGEPMDKAGGYGIQELGALFVEKIDGDYFTVMGLPLCKLGKILKNEFGISVL